MEIAGGSLLRILVVDQEFLVAMEVERALTEAFACEVLIATPRNYAVELERQSFDVVVIDATLVGAGDDDEAGRRLRASGAALVFTTLRTQDMAGIEGWTGIGVVGKPFNDFHLVEEVRKAVRVSAGRPSS